MLTSRRVFLGTLAGAAAAGAGCSTMSRQRPFEIVDTHTHFYDPTRSQGVPWPPKDDPVLYRPVLPPELVAMARPLGVRGTIVVEASPWEADNEWVLNLGAQEPFILGVVGHLKPGWPGFSGYLQRYAANPLFRGIRTGGWGQSIVGQSTAFIEDLKLVGERDLAVDILVNASELPTLARVASLVPNLRIIVDHCANVRLESGAVSQPWRDGIKLIAAQPNVFMKVSGLVEGSGRPGRSAPTDTEFYIPVLDTIWEAFGQDRVVFGSNWPVSARNADYATVLQIVRTYFEAKGPRAAENYFSRNSERVYKVALRKAGNNDSTLA